MVTIISEQAVCDGYDILCSLSDGRRMTFHFQSKPENIQASVDLLESQYPVMPEPEPEPEVPILPVQDSPIEIEFKRQRDAAKIAAIGYMYSTPDCSEADVVAATNSLAPMLSGAYLLSLYISSSFDNGYIAEPTFDSFKTFILSRTPEQLMEM